MSKRKQHKHLGVNKGLKLFDSPDNRKAQAKVKAKLAELKAELAALKELAKASKRPRLS